MRTHAMSVSEFMSGEYKQSKKKVSKKWDKKQVLAAGTAILPLAAIPHLTSYAHAPEAVPAASLIKEETLNKITHALDPVIDLLVAISFPVASVVIIGSCFYFMFGNSEKAWSGIQAAGLGYVLIQVSPLLLNVLKEIGGAVI
jgi:hypothetical protein